MPNPAALRLRVSRVRRRNRLRRLLAQPLRRLHPLLLRLAPKHDGEILGGLYFTNSIGAAFGALFCTFVLLPWIGMPGAVEVAGCVNLVVAALAACIAMAIKRSEGAADASSPFASPLRRCESRLRKA